MVYKKILVHKDLKETKNKGGRQMVRRFGIWVSLAAIVSFMALPVQAAVQNVKVSGDITAMGVARNNLDLDKDGNTSAALKPSSDTQDAQKDLLSIARVRVDADLTDNVSTTVRILNERNWNGESTAGVENNRNIGFSAGNTASTEKQTDIDLAYVTLKEFLYSPLTLTVGRQELRFGNGWIVGDPDTNGVALNSTLAEGDLSARKSFDAIRAKFDYNPLVIDLVYAKVAENNTVLNDDTTLGGINAAYELDENTLLEGFFFSKVKGNDAAAVTNIDTTGTDAFARAGLTLVNRPDIVNTVGLRAVNKSINNLTLDLQGAFQFGRYNPKFDPNARWISTSEFARVSYRRAWGAEAMATYDLKDVSAVSKWEPSLTGVYVYLSGESRDKIDNEDYKGWSGMFEDQTFGHLINAVLGFSNTHLAGASLKLKPTADITAKLDYVSGWFAKRYPEGRAAILSGVSTGRQFVMGKTAHYGQEIDLTLSYDYTEDVQLSLLGGIFLPTKAINTKIENLVLPYRNRAAAVELIGSMKVTF